MSSNQSKTPNLVYISDVPVESSYHGSALIYRLLQDYPPDKLRIIETNLRRSRPELRIPSIDYAEIHLGWPRPLYTRFASLYRAWLTRRAPGCQSQLQDLLSGFSPQAILTVTHGFAWRTAARFAATNQLPLHLICHDDLPGHSGLPAAQVKWLDHEFGRVYRQAASRLCVSPFMCNTYSERYGADGQLLYPSRALDCPQYHAPPERLRIDAASVTGVYAGSINSESYAESVRILGTTLADLGGRLLLFGPLKAHELSGLGLDLPNIINCGLVPFRELIDRCRMEADFLYVPMSFSSVDRVNMELSFPSKLADYTASGIPLLIRGPVYCSAVRWAKDNPGVAEFVETEDATALRSAVQKISENGPRRFQMASHALTLGGDLFSYTTGHRLFHTALSNQ